MQSRIRQEVHAFWTGAQPVGESVVITKETLVRKILAGGLALVCISAAGCGGGALPSSPSPTTPTAPTTPTPPANRAPVINSLNFAPTFGVMGVTEFEFNASASDPDGDDVAYAWDVAGNAFSGTSGKIAFLNGF